MPDPKKKKATRQDSLDVYNQSRKVEKYYNTKPGYKGSRQVFDETTDYAHIGNDAANKSYINSDVTIIDPTGMKQQFFGISKDEYRKNVDKNKYWQREIYHGQLNGSAPMQLFDRRIQPKKSVEYTAETGDMTKIFTYNTIANKPFDLLTEKEKAERVKTYGRDGVPDSYGKINTVKKLETKTTIPQKIVKNNNKKLDSLSLYNDNPFLPNKEQNRQKINPLQNNLQPAGLILSDTNISADINTLRPNVINPKFYKIHEEHGNGNTTDYQVSDVNNINTDQNRKQIITPQYAYGGNLNNNNMPDPIKKSSWNIQQAKVKAEKDAKLKLLLQDKEFLNNLKEQSKKNNKNKEVNIKPSDATKVVIKNRPELTSKVARNKTDKEIAEERKAIREKSDANVLNQYSTELFNSDNWNRQNIAESAQGLESKFRVSDKPNFFDDYLNPANMIGGMAANLGQSPLRAQQSDSYMPYVTSIGTPLAVGAVAGLGANSTGQFVNNLANPLAGTGDLVNNLGNKYLPNAYKLNPKAFRENPNAYYRQVFGEEASKSPIITESMLKNNDPKGIKSLWIDAQPKQQIWNKDEQILDILELPRTGIASNNALPYFNKGKRYYANNNFKGKPKEFLLETKFDAKDYEDFFPASMRDVNINPEQAGLANKVFGDVRALNPFSKEGHNLSNYNLYKKDWLQGYKQVEVPKPTSNFKSEIDWAKWNKEIPENRALMQEYNAIDYKNNPLSDKEKEMYKWFDEQMRFDKLPQTTNKQSIEVLDNFKQRIRTPEGQKRLKELGITEEQLLQDLKIVEDPNTYGYYREAKNTIAMNPNHPLPKKVVRHEIEHGVQNALRQSKINKAVDGTVDDKMKALEINTTEIDDILSGLTLRREGTPNKVWSKLNINEPVNINNYKSLVNNKQNATDYFLTGSEGAEKSAFLGEVQQYMMDIGKIPKDSYTKITPEMVKETMIDAMFDEAGGGKYLRLFNIIKADSKNYEMISKALNKMLSISPLIGAGAYMQNKEYKNGGAIGNNGMFDMTNPNIYKSIVPIAGASYLATQGQEESKKLQQGGYINQNTNMSRYAQGGDLTQFNEGGLHHQNPLGGIPLGTSNDGKTNMVEQGETKNGNYIYSNRLSVSSDLAKQMFLPNYIKNKSFADASKSINDKFKDRNDTHSNATKKELLDRLTQAQENVKAQQAQINQAMQANSQQIPDQMNGEIPQGMEQFAEGGYYDNNNPYFSQDVMNPGTNPMGPYNQTPISLPSPAGLSKLSNPGLSAPTDMGMSAGQTPVKGGGFATAGNVMGGLGIVNSLSQGDTAGAVMGGAQMAAANGLFGAGASGAMAAAGPALGVLGAATSALSLNELSKGNGASRNKTKSAITGAMTGAAGGAAFGPPGIAAGAGIGAIAGGIGSGNRREQDAELGSLNAKNANNVFRDKRYAAYGGPLLNKNPMKGIAANAYNTYNTPISDGTLDDFALTSDLVNQYKIQNPVGPLNAPSINNFTNNFGEPNKFNREINPAGYAGYDSYANLGQSDNLYQKPKSNFLGKLKEGINNNTVGNALRLAPVAMNAYQLAKLKKPGHESLSRLSNTYKPQFIDEASLQNAVGNENRNTINALTNSSGGSEAALRAGILGAGLNATRGRSDAYMKMRDYNNQQNIAGQQFQLGVDQANMSQSNLEMDINDKNQGNYDTQKSKLIGQIGTDLGSIGKERLFADKAGKMFGYDENGKYILTPEGKKSYISDSEESTSLTDEQKAYLKTMPKAFGGYLRTNKKGY